jgi:hypothetical protein
MHTYTYTMAHKVKAHVESRLCCRVSEPGKISSLCFWFVLNVFITLYIKRLEILRMAKTAKPPNQTTENRGRIPSPEHL